MKKTIGIISPAGAVKNRDELNQAVEFLRQSGFDVVLGQNVLASADYLAGRDELRLADLHWAFSDASIDAVLCSRGGYGTARLLPHIDFELIKKNSKPFLGYSDITTLLNTLPTKTFHAPMAVGDFGHGDVDTITRDSFFAAISGNPQKVFSAMSDFETITSGTCSGTMFGGNITVLASLLGTPYMPDFEGKILLLEDVNEDLYKLDRMLTQLKLAGVFEKISGAIFAGFGKTEVFAGFLRQFLPPETPAIKGFYASHSKTKYTLPFFAPGHLDAASGVVTFDL